MHIGTRHFRRYVSLDLEMWSADNFLRVQLLQPMFPGSLPGIKANLFNVILVLDLSYTSSLNFISGPMSNILNRDLPLRFGVVPQIESADGASLLKMLSETPNL